jgi:hypothetical protein
MAMPDMIKNYVPHWFAVILLTVLAGAVGRAVFLEDKKMDEVAGKAEANTELIQDTIAEVKLLRERDSQFDKSIQYIHQRISELPFRELREDSARIREQLQSLTGIINANEKKNGERLLSIEFQLKNKP